MHTLNGTVNELFIKVQLEQNHDPEINVIHFSTEHALPVEELELNENEESLVKESELNDDENDESFTICSTGSGRDI